VSYLAEDLERAVDALLQANMESALDDVIARWADVDAVSLSDPVSYYRGQTIFNLDLPSSSFPYITTWVHKREPAGDEAMINLQPVAHECVIHAWVAGTTDLLSNKIAHRYAEALVAVLQTQRVIGGHRQKNREPPVDISASMAHLQNGTYGDLDEADDTDYLRLVTVTVAFEELA